MISIKEKEKKGFAVLKAKFGYKNPMQSPRLKKVVVAVGVGSTKDKHKVELIADRLAKITGQKVSPTVAKKSIASFKVREGDKVGYVVTLRGKRMYDFLERYLNIALPRTKDFRGISKKSLDEIGNYTVSVKEHTIFPETSNEEIKDVFSFAITVVTSAKTKEEAGEFLTTLGFPFKKE
ncbi:MAG: 50S ribosomal protein L5 [Patescibacteria group bacterium]